MLIRILSFLENKQNDLYYNLNIYNSLTEAIENTLAKIKLKRTWEIPWYCKQENVNTHTFPLTTVEFCPFPCSPILIEINYLKY